MIPERFESLRVTISSKPMVGSLIRLVRGRSAKDFFVTAGSNLGITVMSAVGGILSARLLGPEGRGELAAAIVWSGILATIIQMGLPQAITYFTSQNPVSIGSVFSTVMVIILVQSVGILIAGWILVTSVLNYFQPEIVNVVRIYLLSIPLSLMVTYLSTMAQGLKRFKLFNILRIFSPTGFVLSLILSFFLHLHDVVKVVFVILGMQTLTTVISFALVILQIRPQGHFSKQQARQLLGYGLKSYGGNLSWIANARLDQFVMSIFLDLNSLGHYAVAVSFASVLFPFSGSFAMILFPNIAGVEQKKAKERIKVMFKLNLITSSVGAILLALISPVAIPILFGSDFRPSFYPAIILLLGTVILGCNYILSDGLRGLGYPLIPSIAEAVGIGGTILGLIILLPLLGIYGAAWASVFSYGFVLITLLIGIKMILTSKKELV